MVRVAETCRAIVSGRVETAVAAAVFLLPCAGSIDATNAIGGVHLRHMVVVDAGPVVRRSVTGGAWCLQFRNEDANDVYKKEYVGQHG